MIDARDEYSIRERVRACETMLGVQGVQIGVIDSKVDTIVDYVNTRKGAFHVAERVGVFVMTITAALVGALVSAFVSWMHTK
jgi:hypothetical protein